AAFPLRSLCLTAERAAILLPVGRGNLTAPQRFSFGGNAVLLLRSVGAHSVRPANSSVITEFAEGTGFSVGR
ncbi:MAG: hypothetical protein LUE61_04325, partial [Clostridiales bacterium]|nr:hypothetical protein [Clostridiales bacterium]